MTEKTASKISIQNVKAIRNLHIPIPDEGGVVVLEGYHGTGKSTALLAVDMIAGKGPQKIEKRDGSMRGEVIGLGVEIKMDKGTRREGECPFPLLDGPMIARLVNPGIIDIKKADADRTKALIAITGADIKPEDFSDCGLDQPEVLSAIKGTEGPVAAVQGVKSAINEKALKLEKEAERLTGEHDVIAKRLNEAGVGSEAELRPDEEIDAALEEARGKIRTAEADKKWVEENRPAYEKAKESTIVGDSVEAVEARIKALSEQIQTASAAVDAEIEERDRKIAEINREYTARIRVKEDAHDDLKASLRDENVRLDSAKQAVAASADRTALLDMFEARMNTDNQGVIDGETAKVNALLKERTDNAAARVRLADAEQQDAIVKKINEAKESAKKLREAAKKVEGLLGRVIPASSPIKFDASGRLVVKTDRADQEMFADLSDGERWKLAIDIAISTSKPGGIMTIPQTAWQELAPSVQVEVADHCRRCGVTAITAKVTDDPAIVARVVEG